MKKNTVEANIEVQTSYVQNSKLDNIPKKSLFWAYQNKKMTKNH